MVYKNRQYAINLLNINITKWGTEKKVVENTPQRPEFIGRAARSFCGHRRSMGDHLCVVYKSIGADHTYL